MIAGVRAAACRPIAAFALAVGATPVGAHAQVAAADSTSIVTDSSRIPRIGDRLLVRARLTTGQSWRVNCDGRLAAYDGDTLVLSPTTTARWCPRQLYPAESVERLRVMRGSHGSRAVHVGLGALIGVAAGGVVAFAGAKAICSGECGNGEEDLVTAVLTLFGGGSGGVLGILVGALVPAGPRWVPVPERAAVRVGEAR